MIKNIIHYIIVISILVFVHELGHFLMARLMKIKVLRFSIGFGKTLFSLRDKKGTEFNLSLLPLGGYVKFAEHETDLNDINPLKELIFSKAFFFKKIIVILGGPFFNLIFATLIYWGIFLQGISHRVPMLGVPPPGSLAESVGLHQKDIIKGIKGERIYSWSDVASKFAKAWAERKPISLEIQRVTSEGMSIKKIELPLYTTTTLLFTEEGMKEVGLHPYDPFLPIIKRTFENQPAEKAGVKAGDRIIAINHHPISSRSEVIQYVEKYSDGKLIIKLQRDHQPIIVYVKPEYNKNTQKAYIGIEFLQTKWPAELLQTQTFSIGNSLKEAVKKMMENSALSLQMLLGMVKGTVSLQYLNGPISIAKQTTESLHQGAQSFWSFIALLSISLGVINLLPLPILDGGQIVFYTFEAFSGRKISDRVKLIIFKLGAFILITVMIIAFYNDLVT